jgi:sphingomyelin phosphodiesterase acid-like 3
MRRRATIRAFVEKTLDFVMEELDGALPGVPVYWALGNNDSDCGDYKLDAHSDFLAAVGEEVTKTFPADGAEERSGDVCGGRVLQRTAPARCGMRGCWCWTISSWEQIHDLRRKSRCQRRRRRSLRGWSNNWPRRGAMGEGLGDGAHSAGVDVHASAARILDQLCGAKGPRMFLAHRRSLRKCWRNSDVVKLAIFAHTHMDEVRILKAENGRRAGADAGPGVAVKMVSSISPINGNAPSFTVARVDAANCGIEGFPVFAASNATGLDTAWHEEYDWGKTYGAGGVSAAAVSKVVAGFEADPDAKTEASRDYIDNFYVGNNSPLLGVIWPQYVCALRNDSAQGSRLACVVRGSDWRSK